MSAQIVRFPKLLWSIIHSDKSGAIEWSPDGLKVVLNPEIFEEKYLKTGVFKTNRMSSFIRNLHLYG